MANRAELFLACQSMDRLAHLLGTRPSRLLRAGIQPAYEEFYIPKKRGGKRLIENPRPGVKKVQRKLNDLLQAVYFFHRSPAAYGFLACPDDDPDPRNILTNATRHLGCEWLLNMDMQDFFHHITQEKVETLFQAPLLNFPPNMASFLAELCCYKGRLPMGAPTSPILSNLACIPLDQDLGKWASDQGLTYTRYADDMSFSGPTPILEEHIDAVRQWVELYELRINPQKIRLFGPEHTAKEVTGLLVRKDRLDVPPEYIQLLKAAIQKLSDIVDAQHLTPSGRDRPSPWVDELEEKVRGKLEYVRQIKGEYHPAYTSLAVLLEKAVDPPEIYGPLSWLDFGYHAPPI